uniref:Phospholipid phosphatase-related protein type 1 n=1 Tax=Oryzias sinensis TaxID=183150 RepID=A0A8C7YFZ6_9TELE
MFFSQLVIMSGTVLLAYYMECTDLFSVHVQGFFCNDAELMKPYPGGEESSFVPPLILYCVVAAAPTVIIFVGEISMYVMKSTREALLAQEKTIVTGDCCYLNPLIRRIIRFIGENTMPGEGRPLAIHARQQQTLNALHIIFSGTVLGIRFIIVCILKPSAASREMAHSWKCHVLLEIRMLVQPGMAACVRIMSVLPQQPSKIPM